MWTKTARIQSNLSFLCGPKRPTDLLVELPSNGPQKTATARLAIGEKKKKHTGRKREQKRNADLKKKQGELIACCVLVCFAGHRRRGETEKRKRFPIYRFLPPSSAAARDLRAASGGARWETRRHCSSGFRRLPNTVPMMQKVFPVNSRLFWGYCCNFNVIFVYLF